MKFAFKYVESGSIKASYSIVFAELTMNPTRVLLIVLVLALGTVSAQDDEWFNGTFPAGFLWGLATSSYQIEGAWNDDGKGENIWDNFTHRVPSPIADGSTGDFACDSYNKYRDDVQLLKNMGANFYRFSLSWSRILPRGTLDLVNIAGVNYYNNLINELLANGIQPMVTLYHWDLPQPLEDMGGFVNEDLVPHFVDYARLAYEIFGDRVKNWITFNEPWVICWLGYTGVNAPGVNSPEEKPYQCGHTLLKAHALAYRVYERDFKERQGGRVGITLDTAWYEPATNRPEDIEAAERALRFRHGWFGFPVYFGDYPAQMRQYIDAASVDEGRNVSRLPTFDAGWKFLLRGSTDFLGLNHYTTDLAESAERGDPGWWGDQSLNLYKDPSWPGSGSSWLMVVPWGMRKLLNWMYTTYGRPEILITENGYSEPYEAGLQDTNRSLYYSSYINNVLKAVVLDGVDVTAYTAWSLMDNFEWARGYLERFGVHWVNFTDPARPRIPKESVATLTKIFQDNGWPGTN